MGTKIVLKKTQVIVSVSASYSAHLLCRQSLIKTPLKLSDLLECVVALKFGANERWFSRSLR